jgi:RNA-directed DNA polymerase
MKVNCKDCLHNHHDRLFTGFLPAVSGDAHQTDAAGRAWLAPSPAGTGDTLKISRNSIRGGSDYGAFYRAEMRKLFHCIDEKLAL